MYVLYLALQNWSTCIILKMQVMINVKYFVFDSTKFPLKTYFTHNTTMQFGPRSFSSAVLQLTFYSYFTNLWYILQSILVCLFQFFYDILFAFKVDIVYIIV